MKYAYEDLSDSQFEDFIVLLCQKLLGIAVQGFAKGPDGGRDAKFVGTAELHPSTAAPWVGTTIIQAKHTNGYNRSFSETDFFNPPSKSTIIEKEIPRINRLRKADQLDHYMLFANRRLTGNTESAIRLYIADECAISQASIYLCGTEQLELWLRQFPEVAALAKVDPIDSPLIVSPQDLAEVVEAFAHGWADLAALVDDPPSPRVSYAEKNLLNNMSADYAHVLRKRYLKDTHIIGAFLADPENREIMKMYESVADELQLKITAHRKVHQTFDKVMEYMMELLLARDPILRQHKRLTRVVLFYMYWHCDIGKEEDA